MSVSWITFPCCFIRGGAQGGGEAGRRGSWASRVIEKDNSIGPFYAKETKKAKIMLTSTNGG